MFLIRSVEKRDLKDILALSRQLDTVNLPPHARILKKMIERSEKSFAGRLKQEKAQYVFVLEDTLRKKVVGVSKIFARHGTPARPHVYFETAHEKVSSRTLGIKFKRKVYRFGADPLGFTEIGGLVLDRRYRRHPQKLGKQLSWARFLLMKAHPSWFKKRVIAELLPPFRAGGESSLWNHYGSKMTGLSYKKADILSFQNKEFILNLFPRNDLYFDLLPKEVQEDIEKTGPGSKGAEVLLRRIGFRYAGTIDPFDGGPHYRAPLKSIQVYRSARRLVCRSVASSVSGPKMMVLAEGKGKIRALVTRAKVRGKNLYLPQEAFDLLNAEEVYVVPFGSHG
ncbi:MAG: arginine N-succinyltransferase [Deltaproteobacteria bacterium]|nr:arginine N-succinyltransferase [Deltaproteobacteria bacterium]